MEFFLIILFIIVLAFFVWIGFKKNKDNRSDRAKNEGTTKRVG